MTIDTNRAIRLTLEAMSESPRKLRGGVSNPNLTWEHLQEVRELVDGLDDTPTHREKASRYLGWLQGVAEGQGLVAPEELRRITAACGIQPPDRGEIPIVALFATIEHSETVIHLPDLSLADDGRGRIVSAHPALGMPYRPGRLSPEVEAMASAMGLRLDRPDRSPWPTAAAILAAAVLAAGGFYCLLYPYAAAGVWSHLLALYSA